MVTWESLSIQRNIHFTVLYVGLGIDSYDAPYWKERGQIRFYRYIKGSGKGLSHAR